MATQYIEPGDTALPSPSADDDLLVLGGSAQIVTNVDWSAVTQAAIVEVSEKFNGSFGTNAAPFKGRIATRLVYAAQGGDMFWVSDGSVSDISPRALHIGGGHLHFGTTGTVTDMEIAGSGTASIATAVAVTNLFMTSGRCYFYDDGSTDPTLIEQHGGTLWLERGCTTLVHSGGSTTVDAGTNTFSNISLYGSGFKLSESGNITTLNAYAGLPDVSELVRTLTISTTNINLTLPGAREFLAHPLITFSATNEYLGR